MFSSRYLEPAQITPHPHLNFFVIKYLLISQKRTGHKLCTFSSRYLELTQMTLGQNHDTISGNLSKNYIRKIWTRHDCTYRRTRWYLYTPNKKNLFWGVNLNIKIWIDLTKCQWAILLTWTILYPLLYFQWKKRWAEECSVELAC